MKNIRLSIVLFIITTLIAGYFSVFLNKQIVQAATQTYDVKFKWNYPLADRVCRTASLTEQLNIGKVGTFGAGCESKLRVRAHGKWELTGGWSDTPDYSWETDHFYEYHRDWPAGGGACTNNSQIKTKHRYVQLNFPCKHPTYQITQKPAVLTLEKTNDLATSDPLDEPNGKEYVFEVANTVKRGDKFTVKFAATTTCDPQGKTKYCQDCTPQECWGWIDGLKILAANSNCETHLAYYTLNPRNFNNEIEITAGDPCGPPATPTATPIPTNTPIPTITVTPIPTATTTPIPSPTPPAACKCDSMNYEGTIAPGNTVSFIAYAQAVLPDTTKVLYVVFHAEINGTEVDKSGQVAAVEDPAGSGKYYSRWAYTIPTTGTGEVHYRIWAEIACAYKTTQLNPANRQIAVLGASDQRVGFWGQIMNFFSSLFGRTSTTQPVITSDEGIEEEITVTPLPSLTPTTIPQERTSLKLGDFNPVPRIEKGCKEINFYITYF